MTAKLMKEQVAELKLFNKLFIGVLQHIQNGFCAGRKSEFC